MSRSSPALMRSGSRSSQRTKPHTCSSICSARRYFLLEQSRLGLVLYGGVDSDFGSGGAGVDTINVQDGDDQDAVCTGRGADTVTKDDGDRVTTRLSADVEVAGGRAPRPTPPVGPAPPPPPPG